jgi:hypothetical protein
LGGLGDGVPAFGCPLWRLGWPGTLLDGGGVIGAIGAAEAGAADAGLCVT